MSSHSACVWFLFRKNMEDAHIACTEVAEVGHTHSDDMVGLFGVFDGHGGRLARVIRQAGGISLSICMPVTHTHTLWLAAWLADCHSLASCLSLVFCMWTKYSHASHTLPLSPTNSLTGWLQARRWPSSASCTSSKSSWRCRSSSTGTSPLPCARPFTAWTRCWRTRWVSEWVTDREREREREAARHDITYIQSVD